MMASLGLAEVKLQRTVRVAVLSTGNEVCALGQQLPHGSIYDSNRYALMASLQRMGAEVYDLGIVPDHPKELKRRLAQASSDADVIISSAGVSVGEADHVRPALAELGQIRFWKIAMKPGRPLAFGRIGRATFFGLPGNPVAVLVTFYWLVKPVLEKRMGIVERPLIALVPARAETRLRKQPGRMEFQRGILRPASSGGYRVAVTGEQGSGILRSMSLANALVVLPHERGMVEAGEWVNVLPLAAVV
jgi:molybdopterin molybdotransferase